MTSSEAARQIQSSVLRQLFPHAKVASLETLRGGISSHATLWEVSDGPGNPKQLVVRSPSLDSGSSGERDVAVRRAAVEARVLQLLEPTVVRAPRLVHHAPEAGTLVLEFVPGALCFTAAPSHSFVSQLAAELALLHQLPFSADALAGLPQRRTTVESELDVVPPLLDEDLREPEVRRLLRTHVPRRVNEAVLLHGDFWPGNCLWQGEQLVAVIDWEEAEVGDPLSDVAIARLDLLWAFGERVMDDFTEQYFARNTVDGGDLPWWDLVSALRPALQLDRWASVYSEPPICRPDVTVALMASRLLAFIECAAARLAQG